MASRPEGGWDALAGLPSPRLVVAGDRQLGAKAASVHASPKGAEFGVLGASRWVRVKQEEGAWALISAGFDGGTVEGWIEKKRLLKVKKGSTPPAPEPAARFAAVGLGRTAVQWVEPEQHEEEEAVLDLVPLSHKMVEDIETLRIEYARVLSREPGVHGEVTLRLVVEPSGKVLSTHVAVDSLKRAELVEATRVHLDGLEFSSWRVPRRRSREPVDHNLEVWAQILFLPLGR